VFLMPQFQQLAAGQGALSAGLRLLPGGIAPFLIAPRAGALADRIGERALVVTGVSLQAGGMAWIAAAVRATSGYPALIAPMALAGAAFAAAAGIALAGVVAALILPRRANHATSAPPEPRLPSRTAQAPADSTR
jgi:hypothetical protein